MTPYQKNKPGWEPGQDKELRARVQALHEITLKELYYGIIGYLRERDSFKKEYFIEILDDAEKFEAIVNKK